MPRRPTGSTKTTTTGLSAACRASDGDDWTGGLARDPPSNHNLHGQFKVFRQGALACIEPFRGSRRAKSPPSPGSQGGCDMQQASIMCLSTRRARLPSSGSVIMQPLGWEGRGGLRETTHPSSWASSDGFADTFVNMGWDDDDDEW